MSQFVRIPDSVAKDVVAAVSEQQPAYPSRIPPEYYSPIPPIRWVFWQRLYLIDKLIGRFAADATNALDFGGGGGLFAPSLCRRFEDVVLLDLGTTEAVEIKQRFTLDALTLVEADATQTDLGEGRFDVAVAADVLEHFADLDAAVDPISRWLKPGGWLFTSLPTETFVYEALRFVFRTEKPADHYHKAADVERYLEQRGFERAKRLCAPLLIPITPLFYVSAWQKK